MAHELEECLPTLDHESLTLKYLDNLQKDESDRTLAQIIEDQELGWGVTIDKIKDIVNKKDIDTDLYKSKDLKLRMLNSVINGPVDVDKLDYLIRDSKRCHLKYADLIDLERLINNLTVVISGESGTEKKTMLIGTYEKGQSAAESLAFARYLLYQSLYWHHTSRAVRAMLRQVIKSVERKKGTKRKKPKTAEEAISECIGVSSASPQCVGVDDILVALRDCADDIGVRLIDMLKKRYYYKRILTIHSEPITQNVPDLLTKFRTASSKTGFNAKFTENITKKYENFITKTHYPKVSLLNPEISQRTIDLLKEPIPILCDCPAPIFGIEESLQFIPAPKRLLKNYSNRTTFGERVSEVYNQVYFSLINIAAKGRIFCRPEIRDPLLSALGPEIIKKTVEETIKEFGI